MKLTKTQLLEKRIRSIIRDIKKENTLRKLNEGKLMFVKDKNIPSVTKTYGLSVQEISDYEQSLISKSVPELRKLQNIVSQQQDKLRATKSLTPEQEKAKTQLEFRELMLRAAVNYVAFEKK